MPPMPDPTEDPLRLWLTRGERWAPLFAIIVTAFAVPAAVLFLLPSLLGFFAAPLDPHIDLYAVNRPLAFTFLDASGAEAGHRGAVIGQRLRLEDMPVYLPAAFIAMEDRRFYMHNGIDPVGLTRALLLDLRARHFVAGGSTITQQTAKIVYTGQERTVSRKLAELIDAAGLEKSLSKKQILELYLNRIYLGSASYGVDGAARVYFGTSARNVTLAQAAMLATLTRAPSVFSPRRDLARAQARAARVLDAMLDTGAITKAQADQAKAAPALVIDNASVDARNFFFDTAADQAKQLAANNGVAPSADLIVHTTLEPRLQEAARQAAVDVIGKYGRRDRTHQAAVVIMKPDGAVSALIGGIDYDASVYNRAIQAHRQPGSAFKPFVYLAALEAGISPWDERDDEPVDINGYQPANFGNHQYGTLTLADALAHSVNTITVNLGQEVGIDKVIGAARRLGITASLTPTPSLALGTSEVTPLELTGAYAAFADGGYRVYPYFVTEVDQADGKPLYRRQAPAPQRVIDAQVDRDMLAMMWNVIATGTGGGASLAPREVAGKTGTTQNSQDAWFVGFTTDYVAGVWVGNDDNSATRGVTGGTLPAMIWKSTMRAAEKGLPMKPLDRSPPQQPNESLFPGGPDSISASVDDEAGSTAKVQAGNQRFPDLPPEPQRNHGGGILGWLFGDDDPRPPPPPPPPSYEDRDDR
jgi:penicillin-binding protein 1A